MTRFLLLIFLPLCTLAQQPSQKDMRRWEKQAQQVTIIRDNWGIPHVYGKTDADAVFGLMYAQCEDDFKRVEMNYIEKLGRMSEVKGINSLYDDLLIRMIIDSSDAMADYKKAPDWLKKLMNAFADGINFYLYKHPETKPALLRHFEPWYPLLWTDGSIGAIITAGLGAADLKEMYSPGNAVARVNTFIEEDPTGSNGLALSYKITASGNSMLYINPHVTFYFRPEVHMVSEEGLNVYGAVTWGQFFVYQGFNEHCGWMHTSSKVDAADSYIEKMSKQGNAWMYEYDGKKKPVIQKKISLRYRNGNTIASKNITTLYTHHGPVMAKKNGRYLSVRADNRIMNGLIQCWQRNKAQSFADFKKTLELLGNISNNTVYADAEGNIAYWHGNRIPVRDTGYNWNKPVDGSTSATEWKGLHTTDQTIHIINPRNGWLQNCNSTPFTAAGKNSPLKKDYPAYMAPDDENFRGINAVRVLEKGSSYTMNRLIAAGYDNYLSAFEILIPALIKAFDMNAQMDAYSPLADPISVLKKWNFRTSDTSVATTLAVEWGDKILAGISKTHINSGDSEFVEKTKTFAANADAAQLLVPMIAVITQLQERHGKWQVAWGVINRYQRISSDIDQQYKDDQPSIPVGYASSQWGMLPSYNSSYFPGTTKRYGVNGNSFVCAVEFGKKVKARSLLAGGESGDPASKHFNDQMEMYSKGQFKDVLFYKEDVLQHVEKQYHPGVVPQDHAQLISQFIRGQHDHFHFNGNVLVAEKGKIIYQEALGYADYNTKRNLDNNSVFELASISKQFTAMGILICKEIGLVNYDDRVIKFFPLFPYISITVRHLLTHTSGLPEYEDQFEKSWNHKKIAYNKDLFSMLDQEHDTLFFAPGTKWKYSNAGYAILASIIEKVSGRSYNEFMKKKIFEPLGMEHTFIYNTRRSLKKIPPDYALGFVYADSLKRYILPDSLGKFDYVYYLDGIVGDGTVNSTTGDLFKWDRALYGNKLVSKETLDEMLSPLVLTSPRDSSNYYGFGVFVQPHTDKGKVISHSGGWPGYVTYMSRFVDSNQTIIILSNNESSAPQFNAGIQSILANEPLLMPYEHKEVMIDTSLLDKYAGKYSAFLTLTFIKKNGKLYRHRQGTADIELKPESNIKFFYADGTDRQIEFEVDTAGNVTKAWFINTGQRGELKKIK